MGNAALVSAVADAVQPIARELRLAVPDHWTGKAAAGYQRTADNLATGLGRYETRVRGLASLIHLHEQELAAVRAALSAGGQVAV